MNAQGESEVRTFPTDEPPGFGDGFDAAVGVLATLWVGAVVVLGFVIPLLVLAPVVGLLYLAARALGRRRDAAAEAAASQLPPPPAADARPVEADRE